MLCSLLRNPCYVNFNKKRVNRSFLTKPFWSRWPAIGFILFCSWTLTSLSPYKQAEKKTRIQPSWHTYKWMRFWFRVVKSIRLPMKITTYLISIGWLLCLAFLYGWRFLNKISLDRPLTLTTQPSTSKLSDNPVVVRTTGKHPTFLLERLKLFGFIIFSNWLLVQRVKEIYFPFTLPSSLPCPQVKSVISETTLGW